MSHHRFWIASIAFVLGIALCGTALGEAQKAAGVHALVLGNEWFRLDKELAKQLEAEGIHVVVRKLGQPISREQLDLFHVVILPDLLALTTPYFVPRRFVVSHLNAKRNVELLRRYVADGGGLFFSPYMTGGGEEVAENANTLIQPWGAHILAAQVRDDASAGRNGTYAWTTNIAESPVTEGVSAIWYPTNMLRWDDAYATVPLVVEDNQWQAVVRGMPSSAAAKGINYTTWEPIPGRTAPAIAAVRQIGKGRVALFGIAAFYTFTHPFSKDDWIGESNTGPIEGAFLTKGDGARPSDGLRLLVNLLKWLGKDGRGADLGGYTQEKLAALPEPESTPVPAWMTWNEQNGARPFKVLIGARSSASDGEATVAQLAAAARQAGYDVLVMTETFQHLSRPSWQRAVAACEEASDDNFLVMPGFDIEDVYGNRYLCFGSKLYPDDVMLSADRKKIVRTNYLSLGFGTHFTAIHRPSTTPMAHQMLKHYTGGITLYTYEKGKLVDDGTLAWQWQLNNVSNPIPLVVHEVRSADEVARAAGAEHQFYVHADAVPNVRWYLRAGIQHFWEQPSLCLVSGGPRIKELRAGRAVIESDEPIAEVRLISNHYPERIWRPNEKRAELNWHLPPSHLRWAFLHVRDAAGRIAVTPGFPTGPTARYTWRCGDRQNWFGYATNYTGTILQDVEPKVPTFGTREGQGLWPGQTGSNLCPLLDLVHAGPAVYITEATIDQRYWQANWDDVAYDAQPSRGTSPSRVYQGRVRYYDFNYPDAWSGRQRPLVPMLLIDVELSLRMPVAPESRQKLFPTFANVGRQPVVGRTDTESGKEAVGKLEEGLAELTGGGYAGNLVALSPGLRVSADGDVGFPAPDWSNGPIPTGTSWRGRYVRIPADADINEMRAFMGVAGQTPYRLELSRGRLARIAYMAELDADRCGTAGLIRPAEKMPYALPLRIAGLNANWPAAVWREGGKITYFGVFEGNGLARLDVTTPGRFYAGNVLAAGDPGLRLSILNWNAGSISVEANNTRTEELETTLNTPAEIKGMYRLDTKVKIPAGGLVRLEFKN